MRRFGQVIGIDPSGVERYRSFHQKIWPEIESAIRAAGIRNYSIFIDGDQLFGYFEYHAPDDEFQARDEMSRRGSSYEGMVGHHGAAAEAQGWPPPRRVVADPRGSFSPGLITVIPTHRGSDSVLQERGGHLLETGCR